MEIDTTPNLMEYFMKVFDSAKKKTGLHVSDETDFYIVNMLTEFIEPDKLEKMYRTPITLMVKKVFDNPDEIFLTSKKMGDLTSYICGFLPERLDRQTFKYYIELGKAGYNVASRIDKRRSDTFKEMEKKIPHIVKTFHEIKDSRKITSDQEILEIYERWVRTGSSRLKKLLIDKGHIPMDESQVIH